MRILLTKKHRSGLLMSEELKIELFKKEKEVGILGTENSLFESISLDKFKNNWMNNVRTYMNCEDYILRYLSNDERVALVERIENNITNMLSTIDLNTFEYDRIFRTHEDKVEEHDYETYYKVPTFYYGDHGTEHHFMPKFLIGSKEHNALFDLKNEYTISFRSNKLLIDTFINFQITGKEFARGMKYSDYITVVETDKLLNDDEHMIKREEQGEKVISKNRNKQELQELILV